MIFSFLFSFTLRLRSMNAEVKLKCQLQRNDIALIFNKVYYQLMLSVFLYQQFY